MVLVPELDVVIVHMADLDKGGVGDLEGIQLMDRIFAARISGPSNDSKLGELRREPLGKETNPRLRANLSALDAVAVNNLQGLYRLSPRQALKFYEYDKRMFVQTIGLPYPDIEVFVAEDGSLQTPIVDVVFTPDKALEHKPTSIEMQFRGRTMTATRED